MFNPFSLAAIVAHVMLLGITSIGLVPVYADSTAVLSRGMALAVLFSSTTITATCCAFLYQSAGLAGPVEADGPPAFRDALYFSLVTFATLGYGDFLPKPDFRLLAAAQSLTGYAYLALLVGLAVSGFRPASTRSVGSDQAA